MTVSQQKRAFIRTFGCQMNEHDSERIRVLLAGEGYASAESLEEADLILFNTCTIREKAHHKAMSEIGRAGLFKRRRPGVVVGVCGCVAQEEQGALLARSPHIDLIFGPDQIWRLPDLLNEVKASGRMAATDLIDDPFRYRFLGDDDRASFHEPRASAFVSIMKGCNCACSYCIVPKVRGREICRDPDAIVAEVARLASAGAKEVTLLGQSVNAYAYQDRTSFASLLRRIADETGMLRIRFTSPHPRDVGDDLIREYAENDKLMPHIHLPVQAGSNAVLARMRRGTTRERYLGICESLRAARPGISITTDLIVGFCGETRGDFEETIDLMQRVEFDSAFAFMYSPRPGTEAAAWADDVPAPEKEERLARVLSLQRGMTRTKNEAQVGRSVEALATGGLDRMRRGLVTGRLPDNRIVHFAGQPELVGTIVPLRITAGHGNSLAGEVLTSSPSEAKDPRA